MPDTEDAARAAAAERNAHEFEVINDAAKRVHTVLCNHAEALARSHGANGVVTPGDSMALIKGAVSGVAVMVARMALQRNPLSADPRPPEEYVADQLRQQFIDTFHETARADTAAAIAGGARLT